MENDITVVSLDRRLKKKAAAVVAAAFFDYPMFTAYFPDPKKRTRVLPWYLEKVLNCALFFGEVYTTPHISGVIFVLPPDHNILSLGDYALHGFLFTPAVLGPDCYARSQECERYVEETRVKIMAKRPYYYLWGLAVDPARHRSGIGKALLRPLLQKADEEGLAVYLETHQEANVAYYEKLGFALAARETIPKHDLPFWCMVREPAMECG